MSSRRATRGNASAGRRAGGIKLAGLSLVAVVLIAGMAYAGYARAAGKASDEQSATATVVRTDIRSTVPADGRTAATSLELAFATSGVVESVAVDEGSAIEAGEVIAELEDDKAQAQVAQAASALAAARAKLDALQNDPVPEEVDAKQAIVDSAKTSLARAEEAYELLVEASHDTTVTALELQAKAAAVDNAEGQLDIAKANLAAAKVPARAADLTAARAAVTDDQAGLDAARAALDDYVLKAPVDGVVSTLDIEPGLVVASGSSQNPAVVIADTGSMIIEGELDEADVAEVEAGMSVEVLIDALDGITVEGSVERVAEVAKVSENGLATYALAVTLPEAVEGLKAGMAVRMQVTTDEAADVLAVPTTAVKRVDGKAVVSVVDKDGTTRAATVTLGKTDGKLVEVSAGLSEGQKVVVPSGGDDS